jgi:hypothetical protein
MKSTAWGGVGEFRLAVGGSTLLKGWAAGSNGGGGSRAMCGAERGRERGARAQWKMARAAGIGPQPTDAGGGIATLQRRDARD